MPILRTPSSRSFPPRRPVTTRSTTACSDRHLTRSSFAAFVHGICAHSHAACSSNAAVKRDPGLAHGAAAVRTP